jgi:hypothetical protein
MTTETYPTYYVAGWNLPGCLPEMEPQTFITERLAVEWLEEENARHAEEDEGDPGYVNLYEYWVHPVTPTTPYEAYCYACEVENLDAHSEHMWRIHGCPVGPLG